MTSDGKAHYATRLAVATYDLFHSGTADLPFYVDCARRFGGPILELGAGTGRVLIALAEAGYEIVGVEVSAAMLEAASEKIAKRPAAAARIRLVDADMKDFALQQTFSLVMIPARAFQFLLTTVDQRLALNCIRRHLVPAGHLVVDLFDPSFEGLLTADFRNRFTREVRDPRSGRRFRRTVVARLGTWIGYCNDWMRRFGLKSLMAMGMWSTARIAHGRFGGSCDRKWPTYSNSVDLNLSSNTQISMDPHLLMVKSSCGLLARYDDDP